MLECPCPAPSRAGGQTLEGAGDMAGFSLYEKMDNCLSASEMKWYSAA